MGPPEEYYYRETIVICPGRFIVSIPLSPLFDLILMGFFGALQNRILMVNKIEIQLKIDLSLFGVRVGVTHSFVCLIMR